MKKTHSALSGETTLILKDPAMTCEDLRLSGPKGKIMAWSEDEVVVVKFPGYTGWTGGTAALSRKSKEEYMPSETVVYRLLSCKDSLDGFTQITRAEAKELVRFPTRTGFYK